MRIIHNNHFKTCRRCRKHFKGTRFGKICFECDKRNHPTFVNLNIEGEVEAILEKRLKDFKPRDGVI